MASLGEQKPSSERQITIRYETDGVKPPVYVAGSFTNPPWQPVEMDYLQHMSNHSPKLEAENWQQLTYRFYKNFTVPDGEYQYKFRLGDADNWVLDKNVETVDDGNNNLNNRITVAPSSRRSSVTTSPAAFAKLVEERGLSPLPSLSALNPQSASDVSTEGHPRSPTPLLVVAKIDDTPSWGEDPGPDGTATEKEAFQKRAADPQPDVVMSVDEYERQQSRSASPIPQQVPSVTLTGEEGKADAIGVMAAAARSSSKTENRTTMADIGFAPNSAPPKASRKSSKRDAAEDPNSLSAFAGAAGFDLDDLSLSPGPGQLAPVLSHESLAPSVHATSGTSPEPQAGDYFAGSLPSDADMNDPSLEKFPDDRDAVFELIKSSSRKSFDDPDLHDDKEELDSPKGTPKERHGGDYLSLKPKTLVQRIKGSLTKNKDTTEHNSPKQSA